MFLKKNSNNFGVRSAKTTLVSLKWSCSRSTPAEYKMSPFLLRSTKKEHTPLSPLYTHIYIYYMKLLLFIVIQYFFSRIKDIRKKI